jgi:hypothetical protein
MPQSGGCGVERIVQVKENGCEFHGMFIPNSV